MSAIRQIDFIAAPDQSVFTVDFQIFETDDIKVIVDGQSVLPADYEIDRTDGRVTFNTPLDGEAVTILSAISGPRPYTFTNNQSLTAAALNLDFNRLSEAIRETRRDLNLLPLPVQDALKNSLLIGTDDGERFDAFPIGEPAERAGKTLTFGVGGAPVLAAPAAGGELELGIVNGRLDLAESEIDVNADLIATLLPLIGKVNLLNAARERGLLTYPDLTTLNGDLSPPEYTTAWVYEDSTPANNGQYRKVGAEGAGSWTRVGDLPEVVLEALVAEAEAAAAAAAASAASVGDLIARVDGDRPRPSFTYVVSLDHGDDANDGLGFDAPMRTILKAVFAAGAAGFDATVLVMGSDSWYVEGVGTTQVNLNGAVITVVPYGTVKIRVSHAPTFGVHAFHMAGTTGTLHFKSDPGLPGSNRNKFVIDLGTLGNGATNTTYNFIGANYQDQEYIFSYCEIDAGATNGRLIANAGAKSATMIGNDLTNFGNYVNYVRGPTAVYQTNYFENVTSPTMVFGNCDLLDITHNTFVNAYAVKYTTETYAVLRAQNNLIVAPATQSGFSHAPGIGFAGSTVTTKHEGGNVFFRIGQEDVKPRTTALMRAVRIGPTAETVDAALYVDPYFTEAPFLRADSLAIGRGVTGSTVTLDKFGRTYGDAPTPGCVAYQSEKRKIIPRENTVGIFGDSFVDGGNALDKFTALIEDALPHRTFIHMPGGRVDTRPGNPPLPFDHVGIYGTYIENIIHLGHEFIQRERVQVAVMYGGVNNLSIGEAKELVASKTIAGLQSWLDLGTQPVYVGCQLKSTHASTPDTADSLWVENEVSTWCEANGIETCRISQAFIDTDTPEEPWNRDGHFWDGDDLHPATAGDAFIAPRIETAIENTFIAFDA